MITSTHTKANKKLRIEASTEYSKDLCYVVSVSPDGKHLNVLWLVPHPTCNSKRVLVAYMHWKDGASGVKLDLFSAERGGRQLDGTELVKVMTGVFYCLEEEPKCIKDVQDFDSAAHNLALHEAKKEEVERKKEEKSRQDELDMQEFNAIHADFAAVFVTFKVWLPHGVPPGCTLATKTPPQPTQAVLVALAAQTGPKVLSWAHTAAHG